MRSRSATDLMRELGFTPVYNLEGGIMRWQEEKRPLDGAGRKSVEPSGCGGGSATARAGHAWLNGRASTVIPVRL